MPKHKFILTIILLFVSSSCFAVLTPQQELKTRLNAFRSYQATFTKVVTDNKKRIVEHSMGKLSLRQPNQFRWVIDKPTQQIIISDGSNIWNYDVALKQVTVKSFPRTKNELPALILSGYDESVINNYTVQRAGGGIMLDAKRSNAVFRRLYLWFSNNRLTRMTLYDHLGYMTDLRFSAVKINPPLNSNLFHFTPPKQVDVVRG